MVGTTGFEPATSRTPSVRATRLRYVPTAANFSVSLVFEERQECAQRIAQIEQGLPVDPRKRVVFHRPHGRSLRRGRKFYPSILGYSSGGSRISGIFKIACCRGIFSRRRINTAVAQVPPRPRNCKSFVVKQAANFENGLHVLATVQPMPGRALHRLQRREFRLPIT